MDKRKKRPSQIAADAVLFVLFHVRLSVFLGMGSWKFYLKALSGISSYADAEHLKLDDASGSLGIDDVAYLVAVPISS